MGAALRRVRSREQADLNRRVEEEREALAAFARLTELVANTGDVGTLAQQAADLIHGVLDVHSAVYFEWEGDFWKARQVSGALSPELVAELERGPLAEMPGFALPAGRREPMFFEHWNAAAGSPPGLVPYTAVACSPLFTQDHPAGMLSMTTLTSPVWSERERAGFRAVGDSLRLAVERTARLRQVERQRERLADLNAELGSFITRTVHNLGVPVRRLAHLLDPARTGQAHPAGDLLPYDPAALGDEVVRLTAVARDLCQLSRLEQQELNLDLLPLGELFAGVRAEFAATPPGARTEWLIRALPTVRGDRALLGQALRVLMTFTLSETRGVSLVDIGAEEGEVRVSIWDDGLGLLPEEVATLFDLAVRTDQPVPLLPGNGGLAQVRRVLARHGGWAWAESHLRGARVVLAFPGAAPLSEFEALLRGGWGGTLKACPIEASAVRVSSGQVSGLSLRSTPGKSC
ncbi:ATP-binding protein [Deinococcus apachensis]|uniref:ATP-binding protein n=1 Tax=Deinococcus apachensis TaxID=309886 RepID=UPI00035CD6E8|nr:HAMP domain-containing sensor histidine kinase [Deinococcus apachensis]